jgi:hypothetical protein
LRITRLQKYIFNCFSKIFSGKNPDLPLATRSSPLLERQSW